MPHLDEGQIHSWLDGALSPDEGKRVEQHVAECNECSARVAEARGLIAASSRILSKLDDVPALAERVAKAPSLVPTRAGSAGEGSGPRTRSPRVPLRRWFRPAYAAAAAVLVVAVGTWTVYRQPGLSPSADSPVTATLSEKDARAERMDSVTVPAPAATSRNTATRSVDLAKAEEAQPVAPPSTGATTPVADQAAVLQRDKEAKGAMASQATSLGVRATPRDDAVLGSANAQQQAAPSPRLDHIAVTGAGTSTRQVDSLRVAKAVSPPASPARREGRVTVPADSLVAGERRRLQGEMAASRVSRAPAAVAQRTLTAAMIDSMVNVFAGCYTVSGNARASAHGVPSRLALLTRSYRKIGDIQTWIASTTATVPTTVDWEWSIDAAFEVIVRRAADGASLSTSFSANTPADLLLRRVNCR